MNELTKGKSPFYPGQPIPRELFVGRIAQITHIIERGIKQVKAGKPTAMFLQGEYGIGKSSLAGFIQWLAERDFDLHSIYVPLGGARDLSDLTLALMQATLRSGAFNPNRSEKIRNWLAEYIGKQDFFGFTLNLDALKKDAPKLSTPFGMLDFLSLARERVGVNGVFLVLDEINGVTADEKFAHFIKGLVDQNAMAPEPLPLLLMLCGVEERLREMIQKHQPVERIFDVVEIQKMTDEEANAFFVRAFESVQTKFEEEAKDLLVHYSAGSPKIMNLIGDAAYWIDQDWNIDRNDASQAIVLAADEVGKKYVDQQVYKALRSKDYHSILQKIAKMGPHTMSFSKNDVALGLTEPEKKKFSNFLQKMKKLRVLRSGDVRGEWIFNIPMVRFYIWLRGSRL